jgi:HEAT repeat protein
MGHRGDLTAAELAHLEQAACEDPDPRVRAAALGALVRSAPVEPAGDAWTTAARDPDVAVRRRACELAPELVQRGAGVSVVASTVRALTADHEVTVVEAAAWAAGELGVGAHTGDTVAALDGVARMHPDPLAREAAVAALGAIGDPAGLPAILEACTDKPAVRRRAVLALAPFDGPQVDDAIDAALSDRDWQVRQAAEDLRDA